MSERCKLSSHRGITMGDFLVVQVRGVLATESFRGRGLRQGFSTAGGWRENVPKERERRAEGAD